MGDIDKLLADDNLSVKDFREGRYALPDGTAGQAAVTDVPAQRKGGILQKIMPIVEKHDALVEETEAVKEKADVDIDAGNNAKNAALDAEKNDVGGNGDSEKPKADDLGKINAKKGDLEGEKAGVALQAQQGQQNTEEKKLEEKQDEEKSKRKSENLSLKGILKEAQEKLVGKAIVAENSDKFKKVNEAEGKIVKNIRKELTNEAAASAEQGELSAKQEINQKSSFLEYFYISDLYSFIKRSLWKAIRLIFGIFWEN